MAYPVPVSPDAAAIVANMQAPMRFGFYVLGQSQDLEDILLYCSAVRLDVRGTWHSVAVPAANVAAFLKIMDCFQAVEGLSGLGPDYKRVPVKNYLRENGLSG